MQSAIWTEHFVDLDFEATVDYLASIGFDAVEITTWKHDGEGPTMAPETIASITEIVDRYDMAVAGTARIFPPGTDYLLTSPDPADRAEARTYLKNLAELCGNLGGSVIPFGVGHQRRIPDGCSFGTAWTNALEVFRHESLLDQLETSGVTIGIEPLSKSSTDFLNTTPETLRFVEEVDHPNIGITIDGYHLVNEPGPIPEHIHNCGDQLVEFHADDPEAFGPGSGDLDYRPIYDALAAIGFDGYVSVEFHSFLRDEIPDADPKVLAKDSLDYLTSCGFPFD